MLDEIENTEIDETFFFMSEVPHFYLAVVVNEKIIDYFSENPRIIQEDHKQVIVWALLGIVSPFFSTVQSTLHDTRDVVNVLIPFNTVNFLSST